LPIWPWDAISPTKAAKRAEIKRPASRICILRWMSGLN
jgi:hypothetical protein